MKHPQQWNGFFSIFRRRCREKRGLYNSISISIQARTQACFVTPFEHLNLPSICFSTKPVRTEITGARCSSPIHPRKLVATTSHFPPFSKVDRIGIRTTAPADNNEKLPIKKEAD